MSVNGNFIFIARANLEWRNIVIEQNPEECIKLQNETNYLKQILASDTKCIDVKIMENEG